MFSRVLFRCDYCKSTRAKWTTKILTQRTSYTNYESRFDYSINEEKVSVRIRK